jgi:hypothetical protein
VKVGCLAAGMAAGADRIDDTDVLRHGAIGCCSAGSGRRPRSGRSCARLPEGMPGNWRRHTAGSWVELARSCNRVSQSRPAPVHCAVRILAIWASLPC